MMGLWDKTYAKSKNHERYGSAESYLFAEKFLYGMDVEDWGCGLCRFRDFHAGKYRGIDGSKSPYADVVDDLRKRRSSVSGILLRHVLEHNVAWRQILKNAIHSAKKVAVVIIFTPFQSATHAIGWSNEIGVPDIGFSLADLRKEMPAGTEEHLNITSPSTQYGVEHLFAVRKQ
jgi:hypothetical protein